MCSTSSNNVDSFDESNLVFILIDTSYWIFYRYFAIIQWWKHAKAEEPLPDNPFENEEFLQKFTKTFLESIQNFKKKNKLNKQKKNNTICKVIAARDCPRTEIWRNHIYPQYKETRTTDESFMGGPFFKFVYNNDNMLLHECGIEKVLKFPNLEGDDIIAITKNLIRQKYPESHIYIIANDHDYLQLMDDKTNIINFQNKNLKESKKVFDDPEKNLFYKIVLGDKSDNIMPIFKKCGPKTCEKYFEDSDLFEQALKKEDVQDKYIRNKTLVDFNNIPKPFVEKFIEINQEYFRKL